MAGVKIALCITDLDVGGAEQSLVALATHLHRTRFIPTVYCLGPKPLGPEPSCLPPLEAAGIEVQFLDGRGPLAFPRVVRRLKRHFLRQQPNLVQTFLFHANVVGRIAARRASVPRVACGIRVAERSSHWHLWVDRLTSRNVDRYVCVSQAVARFSVDRGRLSADRIAVIPNGVDLERYPASNPIDPRALGIAGGRRFVTFVGRLEPQKGLRWLIQSAPNWLARVPGCDLLVVGRGPERERLERLCLETGIADRVHWAGWRDDVPEVLAASQLVVLPSRWEGMPNVLLQAMASGLAVVASDVEGVRELLGESAEPQLVRYGDSATLAERLVGLLTDRSRAAELGKRNRERTERQFTIGRMVAAYEELWASMVGGSK
jgi:glycosyltransferase involved in cell wall biosynthesis